MVLDNSVAALTGYQTHPGTGYDIRGNETPRVDIADIARACGIHFVEIVTPDDPEEMRSVFSTALAMDDLAFVVVRKPCPLINKK